MNNDGRSKNMCKINRERALNAKKLGIGYNPVLNKHGGTGTKLYNIWRSMKSRCFTTTATGYKNYGGRGIKVCNEWLKDFNIFREWAIMHGYKQKLDIDRIDNNSDYCPENCRFITRSENLRNRRTKKECQNGQI